MRPRFLASLLSRGRDLTGPNARVTATIAFGPRIVTAQPAHATAGNVASLVPFGRVRSFLRQDGAEAPSTLVNFPAGADSIALSNSVAISQSTDAGANPFDPVGGQVERAYVREGFGETSRERRAPPTPPRPASFRTRSGSWRGPQHRQRSRSYASSTRERWPLGRWPSHRAHGSGRRPRSRRPHRLRTLRPRRAARRTGPSSGGSPRLPAVRSLAAPRSTPRGPRVGTLSAPVTSVTGAAAVASCRLRRPNRTFVGLPPHGKPSAYQGPASPPLSFGDLRPFPALLRP